MTFSAPTESRPEVGLRGLSSEHMTDNEQLKIVEQMTVYALVKEEHRWHGHNLCCNANSLVGLA